jgi:hypothetical protein
LTLLLQTLEKGSSGRLIVDSVSNIGPHYARTLREWRRRFLDCFETIIVPALTIQYPEVMTGERGRQEIDVFKRKWICKFFLLFIQILPGMIVLPFRLLVSIFTYGSANIGKSFPKLLL